MTIDLLLPIFLSLAANSMDIQQGEPVDAVFKRPSYDNIIDASPVQARESSFRPVPKIAADHRWIDDRVQLQHPVILEAKIEKTAEAPDLAGDIVDADPVGNRGF